MRCSVLHIGWMPGLARRGRARIRVRSFFEYQKEELFRQVWRPKPRKHHQKTGPKNKNA